MKRWPVTAKKIVILELVIVAHLGGEMRLCSISAAWREGGMKAHLVIS
jgi:hypothetical protein